MLHFIFGNSRTQKFEFPIFLINPSQNTKNRVVQKISPKLMLLKILIFPVGVGGRTNIFKPHFKMAKAAAKVNSSFLKDILKLTASQPQEL